MPLTTFIDKMYGQVNLGKQNMNIAGYNRTMLSSCCTKRTKGFSYEDWYKSDKVKGRWIIMISTIEHYWPRTYSQNNIMFWRIVTQFAALARQIDENMKKGVNIDDGTSSIIETIDGFKNTLESEEPLHEGNPYLVTMI